MAAALTAFAGIVVLGLAGMAGASDNAGVHAFWAEQAELRDGVASAPLRGTAAPLAGRVETRVLTVRRKLARLHRKRDRALVFANRPDKPPVISIFEDRTLRPGDAVMMADGMRVFAGARSWPYTEQDFIALRVARGLDLHLRRTLVAIDNLPRA